ncbi:MAG: hypothetical protein ABFD64_00230 [Armatimonadota bacterium]
MDLEDTIQERLRKKLKVSDGVFDVIWEQLEEEEYVSDAIARDSGFNYMVLGARRMLSLLRKASRLEQGAISPGRRTKNNLQEFCPSASVLGSYETQRIEAMTEHFGMLAARDPCVVMFREMFLGGEVLSEENAIHFVNAPVNIYIPCPNFSDLGISNWRHAVEVIHCGYDFKSECQAVTLHIDSLGAERVFHKRCDLDECSGEDHNTLLWLPPLAELPQRIETWPHSVLEYLSYKASDLARYYYWDEAEAAWFVLTGKIPSILACKVTAGVYSFSERGRVVINAEIAPWLPADTAKTLIRQAQQEFNPGGNRMGRPRERNLKLLEFVARATNTAGKRPTWNTLLEEWNRQYPEWHYSDRRIMHKDYKRAANEIEATVWSSIPQKTSFFSKFLNEDGTDMGSRRIFKP